MSFLFYDCHSKINTNIDESALSLMSKFDFDNHIKSTLKSFKEGDFNNYIILSIKEDSPNKKDQAGFFHFPALFQGLYKENKEKWHLCCAGTMVYPSDEFLAKTKAIIIPGSALNIYNNVPFVEKTAEWLKTFHEKHPKIKLLGICFGEQLLCHALGGKVDILEARKNDKTFFVRGPNTLSITDDFWKIPFIKNSGIKPQKEYNIMQAHGDEVVAHSDFIKNYASSDTCKNEVLVSDDLRYFLIQGHPEYVPEFNFNRGYRFFLQGKVLDHEGYEKTKRDLIDSMKLKPDAIVWRSFCYSFLKSKF